MRGSDVPENPAGPRRRQEAAVLFSIVVADSRSPRDGRFIEKLGTYNPMLDRDHAERVTLKEERIQHWLGVGAQPTERVPSSSATPGLIEKPASPRDPDQVGAEGEGAGARQGGEAAAPEPARVAAGARAALEQAASTTASPECSAAIDGEVALTSEPKPVGGKAGLRRRRDRRAWRARRGADQELHRRTRGYRRATVRSKTRAASGASRCASSAPAKGVLIAAICRDRRPRPGRGAARAAALSAARGAAAARRGGILSRRPDRPRSGAGRRHAGRAGCARCMISAPATRSKSRAPSGPPVMVPFTRAVVPVVDLAGRPAGHRPAGRAARPGARTSAAREGETRMTWRATVLTIFPEMLPGPLAYSLAGKALRGGAVAARNGGHPRFRAR